MEGSKLMISAIQNSSVNTPKPQNKVAFDGDFVEGCKIKGPSGKKIHVSGKNPIPTQKVVHKSIFDFKGLPMTFTGFLKKLL